jgi:hypothetical protein
MTKSEFLQSVPDIITHKTWGYGELEIVSDSKDSKGVCYRHENKLASCGNYAKTWEELYVKFSEHLKKEGYMSAK